MLDFSRCIKSRRAMDSKELKEVVDVWRLAHQHLEFFDSDW